MNHLLNRGEVTRTALERHASACLSYLLAVKRIEIRFVLMPAGMFHKKQWLFSDGHYRMAVHGSGNTTLPGLFVNGEQMSIDREWVDGERAQQRIAVLFEGYERDWESRRVGCVTVNAASAVSLLAGLAVGDDTTQQRAPTISDFWTAWKHDHFAGLEPALPLGVSQIPVRLEIPAGLEWRTGSYAHQGRAVDAFAKNGHRGVLAIATGGGKTRTALIAATLYQDEQPAVPILVVVLVPSEPLVRQWASEIEEFSITPTVIGDVASPMRAGRISEIEAALAVGGQRTEVIVSTMQLFNSDERLLGLVERASATAGTMLIADEAHNFGAPSFIADPPMVFEARLGLSATPIRQYDLDGTDALFDYLGPPIFEFGLGEAIEAKCLVPYDYFVHLIHLTEVEMEVYRDLTDQLYRAGFRLDDDGRVVIANKTVERLLRRRRAVLEQADAKITALREALCDGPVRRALIYCSPKELVVATERQIVLVNRLLSELGIVSHQLTSTETSTGRAREILGRFASGEYQALSAMKVLDEGVDVPATEVAYILASTTVEREWVQRRGRVLRVAPGKTSAAVHDFVVVPPHVDDAGRTVLRGEIRRVRAFAELARNRWDAGGPIDNVEFLEGLLRGG
ncbi:DEAD/DEAH box helicase family protein [Synechococcus sp. CBW1107]|uniref:DEAD/DEAH box helicase family protein n=1 Tax=Synechococcus sp. CBW1107 TaxID=2789857 RepID=UPI002AD29105|nr:DEAD/DEAH box helicase family protein [Synechococcus sp. CBW1107]